MCSSFPLKNHRCLNSWENRTLEHLRRRSANPHCRLPPFENAARWTNGRSGEAAQRLSAMMRTAGRGRVCRFDRDTPIIALNIFFRKSEARAGSIMSRVIFRFYMTFTAGPSKPFHEGILPIFIHSHFGQVNLTDFRNYQFRKKLRHSSRVNKRIERLWVIFAPKFSF